LGAVWTLGTLGCSGGSGDDGGEPGGGGCSSDIANNHGHALTVTLDDAKAGIDKTYDIQGAAGHTHSVTITSAQFADLAAGKSVVATSTETSLHTHSITVGCA
jgi:hypothetical protein